MILKDTVKQRILTKGSSLRLKLAMELHFTEDWVQRLANKNDDNNPLTTVAAVKVIKLDMGLLEDSEVLEKIRHRQDAPAT